MEFKDMLRRALELRELYGEFEVKKCGKKWGNKEIMEGLVGDIGDLMKLVMVKEGFRECEDVDKRLAHELSDVLWSVLVLSNKYGIDLEAQFVTNMDELALRVKTDN